MLLFPYQDDVSPGINPRDIQRFAPGDPQSLALSDRIAVRAVMAADSPAA